MQLRAVSVLIFLIVMSGSARGAVPAGIGTAAQGRPAPEVSLTAAEQKLAELINNLRTSRGLPAVPVSPALTLTAKWHVRDLTLNSPHKNTHDNRGLPCGLQSWSSAGKELGGWQALCYTDDHRYAEGMWNKPFEITGYTGRGLEIIYWHSTTATPEATMEFWKRSDIERAVIMEEGIWKRKKWPAMGVGIEGNYAAVWFGSRSDGKGVVR